jgi:hypothetical protein
MYQVFEEQWFTFLVTPELEADQQHRPLIMRENDWIRRCHVPHTAAILTLKFASDWNERATQPCILIFRPPTAAARTISKREPGHEYWYLFKCPRYSLAQFLHGDEAATKKKKNKPLTAPQTCAANLRHTCTRRVSAFIASYVLCSSRHRRHNNAVKVGKSELVEPSSERNKRALI